MLLKNPNLADALEVQNHSYSVGSYHSQAGSCRSDAKLPEVPPSEEKSKKKLYAINDSRLADLSAMPAVQTTKNSNHFFGF